MNVEYNFQSLFLSDNKKMISLNNFPTNRDPLHVVQSIKEYVKSVLCFISFLSTTNNYVPSLEMETANLCFSVSFNPVTLNTL